MARRLLTQLTYADLVALLHYDPDTGLFTRLTAWGNTLPIGSIAGTFTSQGYVVVRVKKQLYKGHRLAYLYMTGTWPVEDIDHINGDPGDNRWLNIRAVPHANNMINRKQHSNNTSGYTNITIHYYKDSIYYRVYVTKNKVHYIKQFSTLEEAIVYRDELKDKHHGEYARSGKA